MTRSPTPSPTRSGQRQNLEAPPGPSDRRSIPLSYVLWCFSLLGVCGLQRFYNRKPFSGMLWLLTFGLCWIGQLIDLFLIPEMVAQANHPSLATGFAAEIDTMATSSLPSIERQLLELARQSKARGFTLNDAMLDLQLTRDEGSETVRGEIERLLHAGLLDVGNDERGRVIYFEP